MDGRPKQLRKLQVLLWWTLALWALIGVTPLFHILRELFGTGREVFNWIMIVLPVAVLAGVFLLGVMRKSAVQKLFPPTP